MKKLKYTIFIAFVFSVQAFSNGCEHYLESVIKSASKDDVKILKKNSLKKRQILENEKIANELRKSTDLTLKNLTKMRIDEAHRLNAMDRYKKISLDIERMKKKIKVEYEDNFNTTMRVLSNNSSTVSELNFARDRMFYLHPALESGLKSSKKILSMLENNPDKFEYYKAELGTSFFEIITFVHYFTTNNDKFEVALMTDGTESLFDTKFVKVLSDLYYVFVDRFQQFNDEENYADVLLSSRFLIDQIDSFLDINKKNIDVKERELKSIVCKTLEFCEK